MDYVKFGSTGLEVSRLSLGCMTYGDPGHGTHSWTLDEQASRPLIQQAVEAGINFFDTANFYSNGTSEEIVGRALRDFTKRDEVVIATKVFFPTRPGPNSSGLSRKTIFNGASSMYAWQFSKALYTARLNGWTEFISMQNHLNLLYREEEREMLPLCEDQGIAVIPWSPLARGRLTRDWNETSKRQDTDEFGSGLYAASADVDKRIVDAVAHIASNRGISRAQVALAWVAQKPVVTAPIIGVSKPHHLSDALAALSVSLTDEEIATLEAPYLPHPIAGFD